MGGVTHFILQTVFSHSCVRTEITLQGCERTSCSRPENANCIHSDAFTDRRKANPNKPLFELCYLQGIFFFVCFCCHPRL